MAVLCQTDALVNHLIMYSIAYPLVLCTGPSSWLLLRAIVYAYQSGPSFQNIVPVAT